MKSKHMKAANQKSKFQDRSEAFKEVHAASKGVYIKELQKYVLTNKQKCILDGINNDGHSEENQTVNSVDDLNINFGEM